MQADPNTTSWSSFVDALRDAFGPPPNPYVPELDLDEEDPEEDPEEEEEEDQAMADVGEPAGPELSEVELFLQRWGRF